VKKVSDPKAVFDNSITSGPSDMIVLMVQSLDCSILFTISNDVRVHTLTSLISVLELNLNCFSLSKIRLEPFLVKRIQKILMNVPICAPIYDSLFWLL
jgi:hypothetical protein